MAIENLSNGISLDNGNKNLYHAADVNRYLGGFDRTEESHPFVKGYFYVFFGFPMALFGGHGQSGNGSEIVNYEHALNYTLSAAEGYTPPGDRQLKMEDVQGMGGVDASFITGQTIDRNFSLQYRDYWGAPIFRVHRQWTQYLNPYFGGNVGMGADGVPTMFSAKEYKGTCMVIQTKPITKSNESNQEWYEPDIIKVDYFDGVVPTTDLKSAYDSNITDNTVAKPTVQYRFDGFPLDETNPEVLQKALSVLNSISYARDAASPVIYDHLIQADAEATLPHLNQFGL